jgi:Raf kinase inhibitor-like YbhB/YbcL family protein
MQLRSNAFEHNTTIPAKYTCQGAGINPPLVINDVPQGAVSLALICDDPDAATDPSGPGTTFDHWLLWNIPPQLGEIGENSHPQSATMGNNSTDTPEYMGPCPPTGTHRYFFRLYALDTELDLPQGSDKETLEDALAGHVLAQTELIGVYQKT